MARPSVSVDVVGADEYPPFGHHAFLAIALCCSGGLARDPSVRQRRAPPGFQGLAADRPARGLVRPVPLGRAARPGDQDLLLWGVATPLLFVGAVWRRAYEGFPAIQCKASDNVRSGAAGDRRVGIALFAWMAWIAPAFALALAFVGTALSGNPASTTAGVSAGPLQRRENDARFGYVEASTTGRGVSDER